MYFKSKLYCKAIVNVLCLLIILHKTNRRMKTRMIFVRFVSQTDVEQFRRDAWKVKYLHARKNNDTRRSTKVALYFIEFFLFFFFCLADATNISRKFRVHVRVSCIFFFEFGSCVQTTVIYFVDI